MSSYSSYEEILFTPLVADAEAPFDLLTGGILAFLLVVLGEILLGRTLQRYLDSKHAEANNTEESSLLQKNGGAQEARVDLQHANVAPQGVFDPNDQSTWMYYVPEPPTVFDKRSALLVGVYVLAIFIVALLQDPLRSWGAEFTASIQPAEYDPDSGALAFWQFKSWMGDYYVLSFGLLLCYTLVSEWVGLSMSIVLVLSHVTAAIFAEIFQYPRPYWADNTVQGLGCDSTYLSINRISLLSYIFYWKLGYMLHRAVYDFPSACCGVSAKVCRGYNLCQLWVGMAVQLTTIPIAEFYLGKAYPDQILLAFLFGQVVLVLYGDFELPLKTFYDTLGKRKQIKFISALLLVFVGLICAAYISMLSAHVPAEYVENAAVWCGDESDPYVINKRQLFLDSVLEIVFLAFFIWGRQILIQHKNDQWHNISWKLCLVRFALTIGLISFFYYAFAGFDPVETNIYAMIFIQLIRGVFCGLSVSLFGPLLMYHCCCARCNGYLNPPGSQLATTAGGEDEVYEQM